MKYLELLLDSDVLEKAMFALILLVIGILAIRIVVVVLKRTLAKTKLEKAAHTLITSLASVVLYVLLGLSVASAIGIDVTGIVALASVLTLSLSLALQNMLANVIGGFTLLYTQPFHSGDYVEIAMQAGTVQEINMSYTVLSTPDNKMISIPNSAVVAAQIVNYSAEKTRRVDVPVTVSQEVPTQKVIDALALAGTLDNVLLEPAPCAVVTGYGEGVILYSLRVWVRTEDYWDVFFAVNQRVKQIFDEQDIAMACSHLNVHLHQ